ncbi:unnamed protein product [Caenorhabditis auriculariae]|uniref:Uncharacterized protein n=1 Tax=Caenorhabditis auriculariae TaxID=2777116 RepID=A0A8S1H0L3_9PELO|nr:unnamed protein product [Caenorhabditis auriculariae]
MSSYLSPSYAEGKVPVNGVALINRHEISSTQEKELQRFIDNHSHILQWKDPEPIIQPPTRRTPSHHYDDARRTLSRGPSPFEGGYNSLDRFVQMKAKKMEEAPTISGSDLPIAPNIDGHNYTEEFPGLEYLSDNTFIEQLIKAGQVKLSSQGLISQPNSRASSAMGGSYNQAPPSSYSTMTYQSSQPSQNQSNYYSSEHSTTTNYPPSTNYGTAPSQYGSIGNVSSHYGTLRGGIKQGTLPPTSPYSSLKRKGVSWLDQERARSLSPGFHQSTPAALSLLAEAPTPCVARRLSPSDILPLNNVHRFVISSPSRLLLPILKKTEEMSQYGSASNLNSFRERTGSPSYTSLGKHRDDYNRFETARHAENRQQRQSSAERDESRFSGFGDRPGSGVELSGFNWNGGEVITSPTQLPKSLKPRRIYYSPIGDGTVAADGMELKRRPVDLTPRVTVTQLQHVERGEKGRDGLNIYEKNWSTGGSVPPSEAGFGSEYGPGSGRNSRAGGALSPVSEPIHKAPAYNANSGPGAGLPNHGLNNGNAPAGDPFGSGHGRPGSGLGGGDGLGAPFGSQSNLGPPKDGRNSVASSLFSDPSYRLDTKTGYLITNPRELIHQYATMTPVAIMDDRTDHTPATTTVSKQSFYRKTEETTEERYAPHAPYKAQHAVASPNKFVRQLRDDTMTHTQREANTHLDSLNHKDPHYEQRVNDIRQRTYSSRGQDDIDQLTQQLVSGLQTGTSRY